MSAARSVTAPLCYEVARSLVNPLRSGPIRFHTAQDSRQHFRIDRPQRRQPKSRSMQSLVQETVTVAVEPEHLHTVLPLVHEDEERAAFGVLAEMLLRRQRQPI